MKGKITNINTLSDFICQYFILNSISINHLKLQKLLYYIQSWHLVYFEKNPLFEVEPEAWVNGPVYRPIYEKFKSHISYSDKDIINHYKDNLKENFQKSKNELLIDEEQFVFLNSIFKHYGVMSHEKLVYLTHNEKPWNEARCNVGPFEYSNNIITHDSMFNYYSKRLDPKKTS